MYYKHSSVNENKSTYRWYQFQLSFLGFSQKLFSSDLNCCRHFILNLHRYTYLIKLIIKLFALMFYILLQTVFLKKCLSYSGIEIYIYTCIPIVHQHNELTLTNCAYYIDFKNFVKGDHYQNSSLGQEKKYLCFLLPYRP